MDYDVKIVGGMIVDGTGRPGFRGDLGIKSGRIVAVGEAPGTAAETIEADGRVVAPGFIDPHTHYDAQILWDRMTTISPWHGVTTAVMGNCGFGLAPVRPEHRELMIQTLEKVEAMSPDALRAGLGDWGYESFPEYMDLIEKRGTGINIGAYLGHTAVRMNVMGDEATERAATEDEIEKMARIAREAVAAGAIGFSTSGSRSHVGYQGRPIPSRLAKFEEVLAIAKPFGEARQGVIQAITGPELFYDEFMELYRQTKRPITWIALITDFFGPGKHMEHLDRCASLQQDGFPIVPQVACRPIMVEFGFQEPAPFMTRDLFKPVITADHEGKKRIYADPEFRAAFHREYGPDAKRLLSNWTKRAVISRDPDDPSREERNVAELAREAGKDPDEYVFDLVLETDLRTQFRLALLNTNEADLSVLLKSQHTLIALSDAGAHSSQLCDACYSTHMLGYWVREKGLMSLEAAVQRLTQQPARLFGIPDRGALLEGNAADVIVFDPATVGATGLRRVHDFPGGQDRLIADPIGMHLVMVNGTVIRRDNQDAIDTGGTLPGRLLRGGRAAA